MKRWYVIQVYTGFEDIVRADLVKRIEEEDVQDLFGEVLVPSSEVVSLFAADDDAKDKKEKIFPGYLLVQLELNGESFRVVASTPRVSRFLGGRNPVSLSDKEVERIFAQMSGKLPVSTQEEMYSVGNEVHISSGPFSGFVGIVDKVDEEREKLTVMVSIFGRLTPVELGFDQVKR